jgi:hypothetical protein
MRKILVHTLSLIAVVLLYVGTISNSYEMLYNGASSQSKSSDYAFSTDHSNNYNTPRQNEEITIVGHNAFSGSTYNNASCLRGYAPAFEHKIQHTTTQYLLKSVWLYRSLTISDIVYPFAYFW